MPDRECRKRKSYSHSHNSLVDPASAATILQIPEKLVFIFCERLQHRANGTIRVAQMMVHFFGKAHSAIAFQYPLRPRYDHT